MRSTWCVDKSHLYPPNTSAKEIKNVKQGAQLITSHTVIGGLPGNFWGCPVSHFAPGMSTYNIITKPSTGYQYLAYNTKARTA